MASTKTVTTYSVDQNGIVFASTITQFLNDDGSVAASSQPNRVPYTPGTDLTSNTDATLKAIAAAVWTPAVISAYQAIVAANKTKLVKS